MNLDFLSHGEPRLTQTCEQSSVHDRYDDYEGVTTTEDVNLQASTRPQPPKFIIDAAGYMSLVEATWNMLKKFRRTLPIPESAFTYYCIVHYWARVYKLTSQNDPDRALSADELAAAVNGMLLPSPLFVWLDNIGSFTDDSNEEFEFYQKVYPFRATPHGSNGYFGPMSITTLLNYIMYPSPGLSLECVLRDCTLGATEIPLFKKEFMYKLQRYGAPTRALLGWTPANPRWGLGYPKLARIGMVNLDAGYPIFLQRTMRDIDGIPLNDALLDVVSWVMTSLSHDYRMSVHNELSSNGSKLQKHFAYYDTKKIFNTFNIKHVDLFSYTNDKIPGTDIPASTVLCYNIYRLPAFIHLPFTGLYDWHNLPLMGAYALYANRHWATMNDGIVRITRSCAVIKFIQHYVTNRSIFKR